MSQESNIFSAEVFEKAYISPELMLGSIAGTEHEVYEDAAWHGKIDRSKAPTTREPTATGPPIPNNFIEKQANTSSEEIRSPQTQAKKENIHE